VIFFFKACYFKRNFGTEKSKRVCPAISAVSLDSAPVKVLPGAAGALKKTENRRWGDPGEA
jgi:hypothetical protein